MNLETINIFLKVAELASFTRAADQLGITKARASSAVLELERQLGTRLLHRTTRTVRVSQDGEIFLERCRTLLADAEELETFFQDSPGTLSGRVRLDLPIHIAGQVVIPALRRFLTAHPLLEIEISSTDRRVDPVTEGFDCVLRVGEIRELGLVARRLGTLRMVNCASADYVAAHGDPQSLNDLDRHLLVNYAPSLGGRRPGWEFRDGTRYGFKEMRSIVTVNNSDAYRAACLAGLGIIQVPVLGVRSLLERGLIVEVLPDFVAEPMPISLVVANRRNLSKRVRAVMGWLAETLAAYLQQDEGRSAAANAMRASSEPHVARLDPGG